ncbi:MAG: sigma-54 dependent transcriptional regulator [Lentisphaeria bacterium]|nr:sigma-54 dependent transcriptional regulator [Lentisphaeria bacterium]
MGGTMVDETCNGKLLIIDDEASICFAFRRYFEKRGYCVQTCSHAAEGLRHCQAGEADLVFLDIRLGEDDGLDVLDAIRRQRPTLPVVVMTAYGTLATVSRAMAGQAFDYLTKPVDMRQAEQLVARALARPSAPASDEPPVAVADGFVGESPVMQDLFKQLLRMAAIDDAPVLITGATGTGKELAARMIHARGRRRQGPFVAVNCGALPESLVESELFGHCRGTFTGATQDKPGLCEAAHGGVLFLDEVGELPVPAQVKLLRFLDQRQVERLGSVRPQPVDVRVIAATNRDLLAAVEQGRFRSDLYYRLAVLPVRMPLLREHLSDVPALARHFLGQIGSGLVLSDDAAAVLVGHDWPGNVRELRNVLWQAAAACGGVVVTGACLEQRLRQPAPDAAAPDRQRWRLGCYVDHLPLDGGNRLREALSELQNMIIARALRESNGNQTRAAARLGLHRNVLHRMMAEGGIESNPQTETQHED